MEGDNHFMVKVISEGVKGRVRWRVRGGQPQILGGSYAPSLNHPCLGLVVINQDNNTDDSYACADNNG